MGETSAPEPARKSGWLKTIIGTLAGVLSGAFMMYLSPLIDKVVKPAKPLANFAVEHQGMTVTFRNRSTSGEGWWDFGDGSPLEPVNARQPMATHTYPAPGSYVAKLTLHNLIGEESERTVTLQLSAEGAARPSIETLDAIPISPGAYAPATFRLVSRGKNTRLCIWDFGDDRELEVNTDSPNAQDRLVTFKEPGSYVIKMAAVNGEQVAEKSTVVCVDMPGAGALTAVVSVADQGTRVETDEMTVLVAASFPPDCQDDCYRFERQIAARPGFEIATASFKLANDVSVSGLKIEPAADNRSVYLTGELTREAGLLQRDSSAPRPLLARVTLKQQRRLPDTRAAVPVTGTLAIPGTLLLDLPPLPPDWTDSQRQVRLELRDGERVVWPNAPLPSGATVTVNNRPCTLSATTIGNQVRVELSDTRPGFRPVAN